MALMAASSTVPDAHSEFASRPHSPSANYVDVLKVMLSFFMIVVSLLLKLRRDLLKSRRARVSSLHVFPTNTASALSPSAVRLVANVGVVMTTDKQEEIWDRYASNTNKGSYSHKPEKGRQVTLFASSAIKSADVKPSECRRNIALDNITAEKLNEAIGHEIKIGKTAVVFAHRRTVPCMPLERRLKKPGLQEEIWDKAGVSCEILVSGEVKCGDAFKIGAHHPERIDTPWTPDMFVRPSLSKTG